MAQHLLGEERVAARPVVDRFHQHRVGPATQEGAGELADGGTVDRMQRYHRRRRARGRPCGTHPPIVDEEAHLRGRGRPCQALHHLLRRGSSHCASRTWMTVGRRAPSIRSSVVSAAIDAARRRRRQALVGGAGNVVAEQGTQVALQLVRHSLAIRRDAVDEQRTAGLAVRCEILVEQVAQQREERVQRSALDLVGSDGEPGHAELAQEVRLHHLDEVALADQTGPGDAVVQPDRRRWHMGQVRWSGQQRERAGHRAIGGIAVGDGSTEGHVEVAALVAHGHLQQRPPCQWAAACTHRTTWPRSSRSRSG